jgi:hypothetical protein
MERLRAVRRARWLAGAVALTLVVSAGAAFAAFPDTDVDSYTGCLNVSGASSGQINKVKQGDSPLKTCGSNQQLVHLSGGDITRVIPGTGLTGGGTNGAVTLDLGSGYQLPQGCSDGEVAKSDGNGTWECAPDEAPSVYASESQAFIDLADEDSALVASLELPAGAYSVTVIGRTYAWQGSSYLADCALFWEGGPGVYPSGTSRGSQRDRGDGDLPSLAIMTVVDVSEATTVEVTCSIDDVEGASALTESISTFFGIQAVRLD